MDISNLTKGSIRGVLHEAESKYGLPNLDDEEEKEYDQDNDNKNKNAQQNDTSNRNTNNNGNNLISFDDNDEGSTSRYALGNYEENNEPDNTNNDNEVPNESTENEPDNRTNRDIIDEGDTPDEGSYGNYDSGVEDDGSEGGDQYNEDYTQNPDDTPEYSDDPDKNPGLKILGLSDLDNRINNGKLLGQFRDLFKKVNDTLNNNIINVTTKNAKQKQVVDIVYNNLNSMLSDLDTYIMHKFQETYEDNMLVYLTYIKRYRIAMSLIRLVIDENIKSSEDEK